MTVDPPQSATPLAPLTYDSQIHNAVPCLGHLEVDATPIEASVLVTDVLDGQLSRLFVVDEVRAVPKHRLVRPPLRRLGVTIANIETAKRGGMTEQMSTWNQSGVNKLGGCVIYGDEEGGGTRNWSTIPSRRLHD